MATSNSRLGRPRAGKPDVLFFATCRLAAAVIFVLFAGVVCGQTPRGISVLARYVHTQFKPEVLSGRIVCRPLRQSHPQISIGGERLTVQPVGTAGKMELIYDGFLRGGPFRGKKLTLVLDTGGKLVIERGADDASRKNDGLAPSDAYMRFVQQPGKPISFTLGDGSKGDGSKGDVIRAATIWELLIGHPEACRLHLLPILYKLRPGWDLLLAADGVKTQLLQMADEGPPAKDTRWRELVEQLGHDSYSQREAADRRLRAAGRRAVGFLRKLDKSKLDAEQRFRVSRIVHEFTGVEQSPREIAEESLDDPAIWLAVARSDKEPDRRTAQSELQRLLKRPVRFDPAAERATRRAQLQEIEKLIERQ